MRVEHIESITPGVERFKIDGNLELNYDDLPPKAKKIADRVLAQEVRTKAGTDTKLKNFRKGAFKLATNVFDSNLPYAKQTADSRANAKVAAAHSQRQAEIAENAAAETGAAKQRANQIASRDSRVESDKDAAQNAASTARAQIGKGAARALGAGGASLQAATTAAQNANTSQALTANRQRADTEAAKAAELSRTQAQQSANAEQMRQQADEAIYASDLQNKANIQKDKLAKAAIGTANPTLASIDFSGGEEQGQSKSKLQQYMDNEIPLDDVSEEEIINSTSLTPEEKKSLVELRNNMKSRREELARQEETLKSTLFKLNQGVTQ